MQIREKVRNIESLRIGDQQKAMLILVLLGVKPAVEIDVYTHNSLPRTVKETLQLSGLFVEYVKPGQGSNPRHTAIFCVSLEKLPGLLLTTIVTEREKKSFSKKESSVYHTIYGTLMGYPPSAVQGFVENKKLSKEDPSYPEKMKDNTVLVFRLSQNSWKEEVAIVEQWEMLLKEHAPSVLQNMQPIS